MEIKLDEEFWTEKYKNMSTGWDIGKASTPLVNYFDQLQNKKIRILMPGAGNSYEAEYLYNLGFKNVYVADLARLPLDNLKKRCPDFPNAHLLQVDFFELEEKFDLIIEQTFFCAINPELRKSYAKKSKELLKTGGKLVGVLFNILLNVEHPPFGGNRKEYLNYFEPYFKIKAFEDCYNSIEPRKGNELFINLIRKD